MLISLTRRLHLSTTLSSLNRITRSHPLALAPQQKQIYTPYLPHHRTFTMSAPAAAEGTLYKDPVTGEMISKS
jgi:hypothetical protein